MNYAGFFVEIAGNYYGTDDRRVSGQWYQAVIPDAPTIRESGRDATGITKVSPVTVRLALDVSIATLDGWIGQTATARRVVVVDGVETVYSYALTVQSYSRKAGMVTLTLADLETDALDTLYPGQWTADDWPDIYTEHNGRAKCEIVGTARHVPAALIDTGSGSGPWIFGLCAGALTDHSVLAVYRDGRVVDASEYSVVEDFLGPETVTNGTFDTDLTGWTDVDGYADTYSAWSSSYGGSAQLVVNDSNEYLIFGQLMAGVSAGDTVEYAFDILAHSNTSMDVIVKIAGVEVLNVNGSSAVGSYSGTVTASSNEVYFYHNFLGKLFGTSSGTGSIYIDNVTAKVRKQVNGVALQFTAEPRDFSGRFYEITADVQNAVRSRIASDEVQRLLQAAGLSIDASSFSAAATALPDAYIDCAHGKNGRRNIRAILADLLPVARGQLTRGSAGYGIWQDVSGSVAKTWDTAADPIEVRGYQRDARRQGAAIEYRDGGRDGKLSASIERTTGVGTQPVDKPLPMPLIWDHTVADKLAWYRAQRERYNARATVQVYGDELTAGQVVRITDDAVFGGTLDWIVAGVKRRDYGIEADLLEYDAAVYSYTAGTLPADAGTGYQPDYSNTPPVAPTDLTVTGSGVQLDTTGLALAYADVSCTPPATNWAEIWFVASNNSTGEQYWARGTVSGGTATATITGMKTNEAHTISAYAVNSYGLDGASATVSHTSAAYSAAPPAPSSVSVAQATGKIVRVSWPAVSVANLREYVLYRNGAEVWRGKAQQYVDESVNYGSSYQYSVRTVDQSGNYSSYRYSSTITPAVNINSSHITTGGVQTANIADNNVTTQKRSSVSSVSSSYSIKGYERIEITLNKPVSLYALESITSGSRYVQANAGFDWNVAQRLYVLNNLISSNLSGTFRVDYW